MPIFKFPLKTKNHAFNYYRLLRSKKIQENWHLCINYKLAAIINYMFFIVVYKKRQGRCFCSIEIQEFTLVNDLISRQKKRRD